MLSAVEMKNGETGGPIWLLCSPMRQEIQPSNRRPSSPWEIHSVLIHRLTDRLSCTHIQTDVCCFSLCSLQRPHTCCPCVLLDSQCSLRGVYTEGWETGTSRQQPQVSCDSDLLPFISPSAVHLVILTDSTSLIFCWNTCMSYFDLNFCQLFALNLSVFISSRKLFECFATNTAIQCTELYEYCQTLGNKSFSIPSFQVGATYIFCVNGVPNGNIKFKGTEYSLCHLTSNIFPL